MLVDKVFATAVADNYCKVVKSRNHPFYLITIEQVDGNCNTLGAKKLEESVLKVLSRLIHCG